jgi:hypothetical protein
VRGADLRQAGRGGGGAGCGWGAVLRVRGGLVEGHAVSMGGLTAVQKAYCLDT